MNKWRDITLYIAFYHLRGYLCLRHNIAYIEAKSVRMNLISQGWMVDAFPKQLWDPALCRETGVSKCKTTLMHPDNMFGWKEGYLRGKKG